MGWRDRIKREESPETVGDRRDNEIAAIAWDEFNRYRDFPYDPRGYGIGPAGGRFPRRPRPPKRER